MTDEKNHSLLFALILVATLLGFWELAVRLAETPVYILPAPSCIAQTFLAQPVYYLGALLVTLGEALTGLALGTLVGIGVAVLVNLRPQLERGVMTLAILVVGATTVKLELYLRYATGRMENKSALLRLSGPGRMVDVGEFVFEKD